MVLKRLLPILFIGTLSSGSPVAADPAAAAGVLLLPVTANSAAVDTLVDPSAAEWTRLPSNSIQLGRTPPLYEGDPADDGSRFTCEIALLRLSDQSVVLRAHWPDATADGYRPGITIPDAGDQHIYKQHTPATDDFADAFSIMVPKTRGTHTVYPSLMMGDADNPVDLYMWKNGTGFQVLTAQGRATTAVTEGVAKGEARREGDGWTLTLQVPNLTPQTPVAFAIWDGAQDQRDGLKYFSIWYEVE